MSADIDVLRGRDRDAEPERVLVVDADLATVAAISGALDATRTQVVAVGTGAAAIAEARQAPFGVALIDVRLPDLDGIALLDALRQATPDIDVVILAGDATLQSAVEALNHGARRFLVKPCPAGELESVVADLLDRRQLERRSRLYLRRLEVQNGLSEALSSALKPEDVAQATVDAVRGLGGVRRVAVLCPAETPGSPPGAGARELRPLAFAGFRAEDAVALAGLEELHAFLSAASASSPSVSVVPAGPSGARGGVRAFALYRLRGRAADLGVLVVGVSRELAVDEHHWDLLMGIANWVGVALERAMLYRRLEVAYTEVKDAQKRLVQAEKLSAVGRLAAGLAHEVGTPLNIISGRAEYLLRDSGGNPRLEQGLKVIVSQIDRISRLIAQVLDFSREYGPVRDRVDLAAVLAAVLPLLDAGLRKAETDVEVFLPPHLPQVVANFNQMQQVFINLMMNSIDAIVGDEGHGRAKGRGRIAVGAEYLPRARRVRVRLEDNGQGIREEHLDKVFDPFFSTKEVGQGTGLGLAVVYGIVTEHGGTIEVESRWGAGTVVHFSLPTEAV